jgi:hypothetical protein
MQLTEQQYQKLFSLFDLLVTEENELDIADMAELRDEISDLDDDVFQIPSDITKSGKCETIYLYDL